MASTFLDTIQRIKKNPQVPIFRMRQVLLVDATALQAVKQVHLESKRKGIRFLIADLHSQPLLALEQSGLLDEVGREHICGTLEDVINQA